MNILREAEGHVFGDRRKDYQHPKINFQNVANLWNDYLLLVGDKINDHDVGMMMILVKIAREAGSHKRDNLVDIAGYAECIECLYEDEGMQP